MASRAARHQIGCLFCVFDFRHLRLAVAPESSRPHQRPPPAPGGGLRPVPLRPGLPGSGRRQARRPTLPALGGSALLSDRDTSRQVCPPRFTRRDVRPRPPPEGRPPRSPAGDPGVLRIPPAGALGGKSCGDCPPSRGPAEQDSGCFF